MVSSQGDGQLVVTQLGSIQKGPRCSSSIGSSTGAWSLVADVGGIDTASSNSSSARRNKVYDNIMTQWKKAASTPVPRPRSSHRRILGGQALPTRQRGESLSLESSSNDRPPSWGNLSDTVSAAVQSAWQEQLLRLKLSRLSSVPMTVLLRQGIAGTAEGCRVFAASQNLSVKRTAIAVVEGTCVDVTLSKASQVSAGSAEEVPGNGESTRCETPTANVRAVREEAAEQQQRQRRQREKGIAEFNQREGEAQKIDIEKPRERRVNVDQTCTSPSAVTVNGSSSSSINTRAGQTPPSSKPPLLVDPPVRGFHLVDLHAVVRNSVEWSHCLPKVEPCFRVSSNRDGVLLGLVHALGGRLTCSSTHDIRAGVGAARRASPVPTSPPRLLDRHVCRSPVLLRASVAARAQLYEVDSADELLRIHSARQRLRIPAKVQSHSDTAKVQTTGDHSPAPEVGPASVIVRLAMPFQTRREFPSHSSTTSTDADFSDALEATYGARAEDVVELAQAAAAVEAAVTVGPECGAGKQRSASSVSRSSSTLPIVGFSIDVGGACWNDAFAGSAVPSPGRRCPDASAPASTRAAPGEAVASATLAESIDAAVAFAVKMARVAAEAAAAAAGTTATPLSAAATVVGEDAADRGESVRIANGRHTPRPKAAMTQNTSCSSPLPFSFRRLHVTGLGEGGARGEPLVALKAALSRHMPAGTVTAKAGGKSGSEKGAAALPSVAAVGRPIVVSADATEHFVAGGVWSTVASIIGRKSVPPVAVYDDDRRVARSPAEADIVHAGSSVKTCVDEKPRCPAQEERVVDGGSGGGNGGAMYYIDDGCYGSLSGALLRGVQMRPLPLRARSHPPEEGHDSIVMPSACTSTEKTGCRCQDDQGSARSGTLTPCGAVSDAASSDSKELPCTVWGPTCDGLDCVCRMTQLPDDMEPGRDWLLFPDVGIRGGADLTEFNGLKPLETFYFIRQPDDVASSLVPARRARAVSSRRI